jgi:hypothetical protein
MVKRHKYLTAFIPNPQCRFSVAVHKFSRTTMSQCNRPEALKIPRTIYSLAMSSSGEKPDAHLLQTLAVAGAPANYIQWLLWPFTVV